MTEYIQDLRTICFVLAAIVVLGLFWLHEELLDQVDRLDWRGTDRAIRFGFNCLTVFAAAYLAAEVILMIQRHNW